MLNNDTRRGYSEHSLGTFYSMRVGTTYVAVLRHSPVHRKSAADNDMGLSTSKVCFHCMLPAYIFILCEHNGRATMGGTCYTCLL